MSGILFPQRVNKTIHHLVLSRTGTEHDTRGSGYGDGGRPEIRSSTRPKKTRDKVIVTPLHRKPGSVRQWGPNRGQSNLTQELLSLTVI